MNNDWENVALGELIDVEHGWAFKSKYFQEPPIDTPIVVGIGNFRYEGGFRFESTTLKGYSGEYPTEYELAPGEILLVMTCQTSGGEILGIPGRIPDDGRLYLHNQRLGRVVNRRPTQVEDDFLYWLFRSSSFNQHLFLTASGTKILHTSPSRIEAFEFNLPPLPIQRRIADILGALDDKIALNRQMNQTLEAMAQALYRHWFVDFGPFQDGGFVDSELGPIPEGWEVRPVYDLCDVLTGGTPRTKVDEYWGGSIRWISAKDISEGETFTIDTERKITPLGLENSSTEILPECTVVVVARGSVGKHCIIGRVMAMNQSCYGLRGRDGIGQSWTYLMLSNLIQRLQQVAYGSVFDTITISTFKTTNIVAPPPDIIRMFEEKVDRLFDLMQTNVLENETLAETRDYLLPKLISGEIEVEGAVEVAV